MHHIHWSRVFKENPPRSTAVVYKEIPRYLFWIYIDPSLEIRVLSFASKELDNSLPGLGSGSEGLYCPFSLSPISSDSSSGDPYSDSTALWHRWFNTCFESHATCRSVAQRLQTYSPKRLVELLLDNHGNLSMWRLVHTLTIGTVPYFTLSHCWGPSQPPRSTMDTISELSNSSSVDGLPQTYRQALAIFNSMGYKYIWIDSLCIVQDDAKDWETESSLMGLTYHHAVCNIAATWAANGGDGCFSTRDSSTVCPTFTKLGFKVDGSSTYQISRAHHSAYTEDIAEGHHSAYIAEAPLNKRGWVVQEVLGTEAAERC